VEFGRKTGLGNSVQMMEWFKKVSVPVARTRTMSPEELRDKIVVGEFVDIERPEMIETLTQMRVKAMSAGTK
jgi:2-oxoglutarate ferredoxin oxidoreductase subunit beta